MDALETAAAATGAEDLMWREQLLSSTTPSTHMLNKLFRARESSDDQVRVGIE